MWIINHFTSKRINVLGVKSVYKCAIFYLLILCMLSTSVSRAQFIIAGEDIYNEDTIGIYYSTIMLQNFGLNNLGHIRVYAEDLIPAQISLIQDANTNLYLGNGSFELTGNQTFDLNFNNVYRLGKISFNNGINNTWINDQGFEADSSITLNGARIFLENENAYIKLNNDNSNALMFNNISTTETYIIGRLIRKMAAVGQYHFPVGNTEDMFLIDAESSQNQPLTIGVKFNEELVNDWLANNINTNALNFQTEGGWEIDDDFSSIKNLSIGLTAYKAPFYNLSSDDVFKIAYFNRDEFPITNPVVALDALTINTPDYVWGGLQKSYGYYALNVDESFLLNKIPNFIVSHDGNKYHFRIPGIEDLISASLEVYDRWGFKVYEEGRYVNQLDTRTLPTGTYYYIFRYNDGSGEQVYQSFFEVFK